MPKKSILKRYKGGVCRQCLNREYRAQLEHKNCVYRDEEKHECPQCHGMERLVVGLKLSGRLKLLFRTF